MLIKGTVRKVATDTDYGPFNGSEHATIKEVFALYGRGQKHWDAISNEWYDTRAEGRFYAYTTAHRIAARRIR